MKIVIAAPAWPYRGGIAEFSNRLALQLKHEGHEVAILTFNLQYPTFLFPGRSQYTDSPKPDELSISREMNSVNPFTWISTGRKIRKEKPDILILRFWLPFMGPCLGTIARIAAKNRHTKVICIFDNVVPHEKRPGDRLLTKYFAGSIHGGIVMAGSVGEELREFRNDIPVKLNPHPLFDRYGPAAGREEAIKILKLDPDFNYMLFFGFIRKYKGLDMLIQAFSDARLRDKHLKLLVAGEFYEDKAPYMELIDRYKLENEIILFDRFIRDDEVPYFFSVADLVVQPYRSATQSGVTQIAYQYEKPMLVTDVGGLSEIVPDGKCGYVVKPDPQMIADALFDYFVNNRKGEFAANVLSEKEKFSWERITRTIEECYREI